MRYIYMYWPRKTSTHFKQKGRLWNNMHQRDVIGSVSENILDPLSDSVLITWFPFHTITLTASFLNSHFSQSSLSFLLPTLSPSFLSSLPVAPTPGDPSSSCLWKPSAWASQTREWACLPCPRMSLRVIDPPVPAHYPGCPAHFCPGHLGAQLGKLLLSLLRSHSVPGFPVRFSGC